MESSSKEEDTKRNASATQRRAKSPKKQGTWRQITLRILTRLVTSRQYEFLLDMVLYVEAAFVLVYMIPYTSVVKLAIVKSLSTSKSANKVHGSGLYYLVLAVLLASVYVERKRRRWIESRLKPVKFENTGTSMEDLSSLYTAEPALGAALMTEPVSSALASPRNIRRSLPSTNTLGDLQALGSMVGSSKAPGTKRTESVNNLVSMFRKSHSNARDLGGEDRTLGQLRRSYPANGHEPLVSQALANQMLRSISRLHKSGFAALLLLFVKRSHDRIANTDITMLSAVDTAQDERQMLRFRPPPLATIKLFSRAYTSILEPSVFGAENIPNPKRPGARPMMFVSNHSILAFDFPILLTWLYEHKGIFIRAMADHSHFQIPVNAQILSNIVGAVDGTRRKCGLLLQSGQPVFLYPGGARETFKRTTDEKYQLFWEGKYGFCRLAIEHGCDIVPVINYGTEDMLEVVGDMPMGWLPVPFLWGSDRTFPLVMPKKLEKIYFYFAPPISTVECMGEYENEEFLQQVHDKTRIAVENGIAHLKGIARNDPSRGETPVSNAARALATAITSTVGPGKELSPKFFMDSNL